MNASSRRGVASLALVCSLLASPAAAERAFQVADLAQGRDAEISSNPRGGYEVGGRLVFLTEPGSAPQGLWSSDGSAAGTVSLLEDCPDCNNVQFLAIGSRRLYFTIYDLTAGSLRLYASDGTVAGTRRLAAPASPFESWMVRSRFLTEEGGLYFVMAEASGFALFHTEGTDASARRLATFTQEPFIGAAGSGAEVAGALYFSVQEGSRRELWVSDATAAGTRPVHGSLPELWGFLRSVGGHLLFGGLSEIAGTTRPTVFRLDGASAVPLLDLPIDSEAIRTVVSGDRLYIAGTSEDPDPPG